MSDPTCIHGNCRECADIESIIAADAAEAKAPKSHDGYEAKVSVNGVTVYGTFGPPMTREEVEAECEDIRQEMLRGETK